MMDNNKYVYNKNKLHSKIDFWITNNIIIYLKQLK